MASVLVFEIMTDVQRIKSRFEFLESLYREDKNIRERIERLYLPTYDWCLRQMTKSRPVIVGVNGQQGAGKSTLTRILCELMAHEGHRAVTISMDDFYLTRAEQIRLAQKNSDNPYLQNRGYPGTHDLVLGTQVLKDLRGQSGSVLIPRYDKSLFDGKGDRAPRASWMETPLPLDLVFFEGWMLGFKSVNDRSVGNAALGDINRLLQEYEPWWAEIDAWIQLKPKDYRYAIDWRVEAEENMKATGRPGMTATEARAFVTKFLPAYELYLPELTFPESCPQLKIEIGPDRLPLSPGHRAEI